MKRTCNGCKALFKVEAEFLCSLGFSICEKSPIPIDDCPKPITNIKLKNIMRGMGILEERWFDCENWR